MELITGATGYVGGRLIERLRAEGRPVRALVRQPSRLEARDGVEVVAGDLLTGRGVREALDGCETAYYLVHSMEAAKDADFSGRDRRAAENFTAAAHEAGVERVVYLGGIAPTDGKPSPHIASRIEVEEILLRSAPSATARQCIVDAAHVHVYSRRDDDLGPQTGPSWREIHLHAHQIGKRILLCPG